MPLDPEVQAMRDVVAAASAWTRPMNDPGVFPGFSGMTLERRRGRRAVEDGCAALREAFGA